MNSKQFVGFGLGLYFLAFGAGLIGKSALSVEFFYVGLIFVGIGALFVTLVVENIMEKCCVGDCDENLH